VKHARRPVTVADYAITAAMHAIIYAVALLVLLAPRWAWHP
jgi:hypothetical protein